MLLANTRDYLYLFNKAGHFQRIPVHEIPQDEGKHVAEFTEFTRRDTVRAALPLPRLTADEAAGYLFLATTGGTVKRIAMADLIAASPGVTEVMRVEEKESLAWVFPTPGEQEVILVSAQGKSIRFNEEEVRSMGLSAGGVAGMKLGKGDQIVAASLVEGSGDLLTVSSGGFAKRSNLSEYSSQGRNGSGIIAHKVSKRTGNLVDALVSRADAQDYVVFITQKGVAKVMDLAAVPNLGRATQGQDVIKTAQTDQVAAVHVAASADGGGEETPGPEPTVEDPRPKPAPAKAPRPKPAPSSPPEAKAPAPTLAKEAKVPLKEAEGKPTGKPAGANGAGKKSAPPTAKAPKPEPKPDPESDPEPTAEPVQPALLADVDLPPVPAPRKKSKVNRVTSVTKSQRKK
jgi:DNA gyrase subunit A